MLFASRSLQHESALVAQWIEHLPPEQGVAGSNPVEGAIFIFAGQAIAEDNNFDSFSPSRTFSTLLLATSNSLWHNMKAALIEGAFCTSVPIV